MTRLARIALLCVLFSLGGCATLFGGGTHQRLSFDSAPQGATVYVNGEPIGVTPLSADIHRNSDTVVTFKKQGFSDQTYALQHHLNPWFWGDVAALSLFSTTVDVATKSSVEYSEDKYFVTLEPVGAPAQAPGIQDHRTQVSQFIVTNFAALGAELDNGDRTLGPGEHVLTLVSMLDAHGDREDIISILKDLYSDNKTAPDFANAVLGKFAL